MDEKYYRLLAEHGFYSVKLLICMYLVQTRLILGITALGWQSFIMRGSFETFINFRRMVKLQKKCNRNNFFRGATNKRQPHRHSRIKALTDSCEQAD
jgi:hypothetical protein